MTTMPLKMGLFYYLLVPLATLAQNKSRTENILPGITKLVYHVKDDSNQIKEGYFEESIRDVPLTQGNYSHDQKNGGWKYLSPDDMVSFTGNYYNNNKVHKWYYFHHDKIFCELRFNAEGQLNGNAIGLYETGDTAAITPFSNGKCQGIALRFDHQHHIIVRKYFEDGQLLADTSFYANGRIHRVHAYQDGKVITGITMDSLGNTLPSSASDKEQLSSESKEGNYPPTFPGGEQSLVLFLSKAIHYPRELEKLGPQGKIVVLASFVIDTDGYVKDITVKEAGNPLLEKEAKRVIGLLPRWSPTVQDFLPVAVPFYLPISYELKEGHL